MPFSVDETNQLRDYSKGLMGGRALPPLSASDIKRKQQEQRKPKGFLMHAIDIINRPLYASANFSKAIVEGKGLDSAFSAAGRGIIGQERNYYSDVLNSAGVKNKYVKSIAGFALDIGLDPVTYLTFGVGKGAKMGLTTLNKQGSVMLKSISRKQLPKLTAMNIGKGASREIAERMARETIEETALKMAMREPAKYVSQKAVRILGKEIPIASDVYRMAAKKVAGKGQAIYRKGPIRWAGEAFIGDDFIIKHAKNLTSSQKNLLTLHRHQAKSRILLGGELAMQKSIQMAADVPNLKNRELIANAIEHIGKRKTVGSRIISKGPRKGLEVSITKRSAQLSDLLPAHLVGKAKEVQKFIFKEITEPELRKGLMNLSEARVELLKTFKKGHITHYYKQRMAGMFSKNLPQPMIARNKSGRVRIFDTMEKAVDAGWQPIEDYAMSVGLRNAYSKRLLAIDDYVQRTLSTTATPLSTKSSQWKNMVKTGRVPEGMGIYMPRSGARFYPLHNAKKAGSLQIKNAKAMKKLWQAEGIGPFAGGEVLQGLRLSPLQKAFSISDDIAAYLMPKEIADLMNKTSPYLAKSASAKGVLKYLDTTMNFWKTSVTAWWPGFHSRNAMSNVWLTFLGGIQNPKRFQTAFKLQRYDYLTRKGKDVADFVVSLGGKNYQASELVKMGKQSGVLSRGWFGAELGQSIEKQMMLKTGVRPRLTGKQKGTELARSLIMDKPRAVGTAVENNARLALFIDQLDKGIDVGSASRHTKKFLFDYGELTDFEKNVMKRVFPFYTWMRKNIPLEVEQMFKQPGKFGMIGKAHAEIEKLSPAKGEKFLPEWMSSRELFTRLPFQQDGKPLYMNFDFAFQDLAKLSVDQPISVMREWLGQLRPDVKALIEIVTNQNIYFGRNLVDPNLPEMTRFTKSVKAELLNNFRAYSIFKKLGQDDVGAVSKILDFTLGLKPYPFDVNQQKKYYFQRKRAEQSAIRKEALKKRKR